MSTSTFRRNPHFVRDLAHSPAGDALLRRAALGVQAEARRRVGVRGGSPRQYPDGSRPPGVSRGDKLRPDIKASRVRPGEWQVGSGLYYAYFHHEGTEPHPINPRKPGGVLVFYSMRTGALVFTKHVNHPGTRPNRYLTDAARALGLRVELHATLRTAA